MLLIKKAITLTSVAIFAAGIVPTTAQAAVAPSEEMDSIACVAEALERDYPAWTCMGDYITHPPVDQDGSDSLSRSATEGEPAWVTTSISTGSIVESMEPDTYQAAARDDSSSASAPDGPLVAAAAAADYDNWCEPGTICCRLPGTYIGECKGNGAYGNQNGAIGQFDVVVRANLNGRQPQYRTWWDHDSGPTLQFEFANLRCYEEQYGPDSNCGQHFVDRQDGTITVGRFAGPILYGNRLNDGNPYYNLTDGYFWAGSYGRFTMGAFPGPRFICPVGTANCYYP